MNEINIPNWAEELGKDCYKKAIRIYNNIKYLKEEKHNRHFADRLETSAPKLIGKIIYEARKSSDN